MPKKEEIRTPEQLQEHYAVVSDNIIDQPTPVLSEKIMELTEQMLKVVEDFDSRIRGFADHEERLKKIIGLGHELTPLFDQSRIKEMNVKLKQLKKLIAVHKKEVASLYNNISIIRDEGTVLIDTEKRFLADVTEIRRQGMKTYDSLKNDSIRFIGMAKEKLSSARYDAAAAEKIRKAEGIVQEGQLLSEQSLQNEAHMISVARHIINLISQLDPILIALADILKRESVTLDQLTAPHPDRPFKDLMKSSENYLNELAEELLEKLREEKIHIHDPFLAMIKQERMGAQLLADIMSTKTGFFNRLSGKHRITMKDIKIALHALTTEAERSSFFGALMGVKVSAPKLLDPDVYDKVEIIAGQADEEVRDITKSAYTDKLTAIHNRQFFDERMAELIRRRTQFCMLIIDIDHFKQFNDTFGHLTGDKVLKEVAAILSDNVRATDYVCRYGGEEFCVILPRTPLKSALFKVAEKLRKAVEAHKLTEESGERVVWPADKGGGPANITISGGLVSVEDTDYINEKTPGAIIDTNDMHAAISKVVGTADYLLYAAKEGTRQQPGRNQMQGGMLELEYENFLKHEADKKKQKEMQRAMGG